MSFNCEKCSSPLRVTRGDHSYVEGGLPFVVLLNCRVHVCYACNVSVAELPNAETLSVAIAEALITDPFRMNGRAIRFLRKAMGLTADEFAVLIGTTRVEVSRWENDHVIINGMNDLRIRLESTDKLLPAGAGADRLKEQIVTLIKKGDIPSEGQQQVRIDAQSHYGHGFEVPSAKETRTISRAVVGR